MLEIKQVLNALFWPDNSQVMFHSKHNFYAIGLKNYLETVIALYTHINNNKSNPIIFIVNLFNVLWFDNITVTALVVILVILSG